MQELVGSLAKALGDRYEVLRRIGEGAHGIVYLARDLRHNRRVAIKVLRVDDASGEGVELRFVREIHLLARLQHPNILPLHDSGYFGTCLYYVMPYVDGETLRERIQRERRLSIGDAVSIGRELADALDCAHAAGIVHRDVKPENVLLASGRPLLVDFGVAAALHGSPDRRITQTGDVAPGTPAYMSPEQLLGERTIDGRADVYALGCVMHEMLTGIPPFTGPAGFAKRFTEPPPALCAVRPEIPASLETVVHRALQREPDSRYSTARELRAALADTVASAKAVRRRRAGARAKPARQRRPALQPPIAVHETPFVGRAEEIATLTRLLQSHRLVTILGQGGAGKSRLAQHVALLTAATYRHGICMVPLAGIPEGGLLWATIGEAIGLSASTQGDVHSRVIAMLRRRSILLVLDGFEHLVDAGPQVIELLDRAPGVRVLVTSRERINVSAEIILGLGGLPTPAPNAPGEPDRQDAIQLFVERVRHVLPEFTLTETVAPDIVQLCHLVDGLPLAIELAASMLSVVDCHELVRELRKSYDILSTSLRDVPERHRNLRAVFHQSWRLLAPEEKAALARLSIFAAAFSREAATAVGRTSLGVLRALSDKSLLQHVGADRYQLHGVIRQHAREYLSDDELAAVTDSHARFYGDFVHSRSQSLTGREQKAVAAEMARELPDVLAGWHHAVSLGDEPLLERYLDGLYQLYLMRSWFREGATELGMAVEGAPSSVTGARILARQGRFLYRLGEIQAARRAFTQSLHTLRKLDARRDMVLPMRAIAVLSVTLGRYRAAERLLRSVERMCRELGDRHELGVTLVDIAYALTPQGRANETEQLLRDGMQLIKTGGDEVAASVAATSLGALLIEEGRLPEAREVLEHALVSSRALGDERIMASALLNLGSLSAEAGDPERGVLQCRESLAAFRHMGMEEGVAAAQAILGELELARGDLAAARHHYLQALRSATSLGAEMSVMPVIVGLAEVSIKADEPERARELLDCALASKATDARNRAKAEALARRLAQDAAPDQPHARRTGTRPLADVVRTVLDGSPTVW